MAKLFEKNVVNFRFSVPALLCSMSPVRLGVEDTAQTGMIIFDA